MSVRDALMGMFMALAIAFFVTSVFNSWLFDNYLLNHANLIREIVQATPTPEAGR